MIHPSAVVAEGAKLGKNVRIGAFCTVDAEVVLGDDCALLSHVTITGKTTIGQGNRFFPFSCIGTEPQDLKYHGEASQVIIGDHNTFRENTTVHRGTEGGGMVTKIGNNNLFQTYTHVAHDCLIGDDIVLACSAILAGHVEIHDGAIVGAMSAIHQFARVGKYAMLGATCTALKDMPPFCLAGGGYHMRLSGLNVVGLKRRGLSNTHIRELKQAYRLLFQSNDLLKSRLQAVQDLDFNNTYVDILLDFVRSSQRGVMKHSQKGSET